MQLTGSVVVVHVGSSRTRDESIGRWIFTTEPLGKPEKAFFAVVVTAFMFLFHNDTSIDLGSILITHNNCIDFGNILITHNNCIDFMS